MSKDKRRYPRVQAKNVSAHLNVADQSSPCVIQNISAGGIFIETAEALPVGMPVAVNLARPGWTKVLRVSGRVVWAMAERTAARKGTLPGMRIKFDALSKALANDLMNLLKDLGAPNDGPEPSVVGEEAPAAGSVQPPSLRDLQARVSGLNVPAMVVGLEPAVFRPSTPGARPAKQSAPRFVATPIPQDPKVQLQVQALIQQLADLQALLDQRERELSTVKERLKEKEAALDKSDRERKAAELAIQRLAMQLSSRR